MYDAYYIVIYSWNIFTGKCQTTRLSPDVASTGHWRFNAHCNITKDFCDPKNLLKVSVFDKYKEKVMAEIESVVKKLGLAGAAEL